MLPFLDRGRMHVKETVKGVSIKHCHPDPERVEGEGSAVALALAFAVVCPLLVIP